MGSGMVRWLPNVLSLLRVLLLWPFTACLLSRQYGVALGLFLVAALTDGLDGWLARRFGWISRWGSIIDPIADKLLVLVTYLLLTKLAVISGTLFTTILARELVVLVGAMTYYFWVDRYQIAPTPLGKICTCSHFLFLLLLLSKLSGLIVPTWSIPIGTVFIYIITLTSGLQYVLIWSLRAYRAKF